MKDEDLYLKVRHAVRIEGLSERAARAGSAWAATQGFLPAEVR